MSDPLERAAAWQAAGKPVALATVIATWGSSPRRPGSKLVVDGDGAFFGSVSGGCVEGAVIEAAAEVMKTGEPAVLQFGVTNEQAWEVGLACGGRIEIYVERPEAAMLEALVAARRQKRPVARVIDLGSGAQSLVGGPDEIESPELAARVGGALGGDRAAMLELDGRRWFVEPHNPPLRMVVVGAVHIAQPLVAMARLAGFSPVVVDPRAAFATEARFEGVELRCGWPDEELSALELDARTAVVTLTHDPKIDDPALETALAAPVFYVGALGSRKTHASRLERLTAAGVDHLERISGPVGLDIGARTPAEIAVAILAEVIETLRRGRG